MVVPRPEPHAYAAATVQRRALRARPLARARLVCEIATAYVRTRRALRARPLVAAIATLRAQRRPPVIAETTEPLAEASHLARAVVRTLALLPGDTRCLTRSLVLTRLLARRGIPATLVIGARSAPDFVAHAWVEHRGHAVLPPGDESFGRLVEL